jgi:hypothetical protein
VKIQAIAQQCSLIPQPNPAVFPGDHPQLVGDLPTRARLLQRETGDGWSCLRDRRVNEA